MVEFVRSCIRRLDIQYQQDIAYLSTLFEEPDRMNGTIVRLQGEAGLNNYESNIGDPARQSTLVVRGQDKNIYLLYKHIACEPISLYDGVDIVDSFCYTKNCEIYRRRAPADVPPRLKKIIADSTFDVQGALEGLELDNDSAALVFLNTYFEEGGTMDLKDMIAHTRWKQKYRRSVETKRVYMCKSCKLKAEKGCCPLYSSNNRIQVTKVVGWHKR